jgi:hypothetical protein
VADRAARGASRDAPRRKAFIVSKIDMQCLPCRDGAMVRCDDGDWRDEAKKNQTNAENIIREPPPCHCIDSARRARFRRNGTFRSSIPNLTKLTTLTKDAAVGALNMSLTVGMTSRLDRTF